jgi:iron complex transport system ATP-binding protein
VITIDGLRKRRGGELVLDEVTLEVSTGECVGIVGPNGSGKTTLIQCINGAVEPDSGTVSVGGQDLSELSAAERGCRVGSVPQQPTVPFDYSAETVVAMGRTPHTGRFERMDECDRTAVRKAMERTRTQRFADRSIRRLSGGERQRVLIARALAQEPSALLLDEPTSALDLDHEARCIEIVENLVDGDRAVMMAIHDVDLAARFCDRLFLLAEKQIVDEGAPESVLEPAVLERVFGIPVAVDFHPVTDSPTVVARGGTRDSAHSRVE